VALERLQQGISIALDLRRPSHPTRHEVFELLPQYAHRRCKHIRYLIEPISDWDLRSARYDPDVVIVVTLIECINYKNVRGIATVTVVV
jgi:hypothetical protein